MGLCKCYSRPKKGNFEVGKYYGWIYSLTQTFSGEKEIAVRDDDSSQIIFLHKEYLLFFKDIQCADVSMHIYIDRKKELLFVPVFQSEAGFSVTLDYFSKLSLPYSEDDAGKVFQKVWKEHQSHAVVSEEERERNTPYYKIVTKGKGWRAFAADRWMLHVDFAISEEEMIFTYWHKKKGAYFGIDAGDRMIDFIIPMSSSCEEIGHTILAIFKEAGVLFQYWI